MASVKPIKNKRSTSYLAEVRITGYPYQSKTFKSKSAARIWGEEQEAVLRGKSGRITNRTMADLMLKYANEESIKKRSGDWESKNLKRMAQIVPFRDVMVRDLNIQHVEAWLTAEQERGLKTSTVKRNLTPIRTALRRAIKWRWLDEYPLTGIDIPKAPKPRQRLPTPSDIRAVCDSFKFNPHTLTLTERRQEMALMFLLGVESAMRLGEMCSLQWQYVYLHQNYLRLSKTKNGDERDVPLSSRAVELLEACGKKESGRVFSISYSSASSTFSRAMKAANMEYLNFHDSRHAAATQLARKLTMLELAKMMGIKDPRILMIYYNEHASTIAQRL